MSLKHLARYAFSLPPHVALAKVASYAGRILRAYMHQVGERTRISYGPLKKGTLQNYLAGREFEIPETVRDNLQAVSTLIQKHHFDLLGSGWVKVAHVPSLSQLSPGNRARSAAIRDLIDVGYIPIDWQLDFKSGFRWREDRLSGTLRYGHEPGVDVKVPWELARFQHLSWLAFASATRPGDEYKKEFRNQVLDFAAANPPGYGVNWLCTMDVAIRAANIVVAYDFFNAQGTDFDEPFLAELHALILAHGRHIVQNLEWHDDHRANHYLADIVGLLFVAVYLPRSAESDVWLAFSVTQLIAEVGRQFTPDGANFEASTSYHRLSAEMVAYGTALVLGLSDNKKAALVEFDSSLWKGAASLAPGPVEMFAVPGSNNRSPFPDWYFERLERMAEFSMHVTKPNRSVAQIGDNDSGRFFKMCPVFAKVDGKLKEQQLDHRGTVAAINGFFDRKDLSDFAGPDISFEASVIRDLCNGATISSYLKTGDTPGATGLSIDEQGAHEDRISVVSETIIEPPDPEVLDGLTACAYPDFGFFIWRSQRFFLSVRCGPIGQNGNGGHAHNDQLAIELNIDGEDWIADPGTYLYTPSPTDRNAYRSVHAHAAPKIGNGEPARLDLGLFKLEDRAHARCLRFGFDHFEGQHIGYGEPMRRSIAIEKGRIRITDLAVATGHPEIHPVTVNDGKALRDLWSLNLPFSSGYGIRE